MVSCDVHVPRPAPLCVDDLRLAGVPDRQRRRGAARRSAARACPPPIHDDKCCPGMLPGQICPMHHTKEGKRTCKMRSACTRLGCRADRAGRRPWDHSGTDADRKRFRFRYVHYRRSPRPPFSGLTSPNHRRLARSTPIDDVLSRSHVSPQRKVSLCASVLFGSCLPEVFVRSRVWSPPIWLAALCLLCFAIPVRAATTLRGARPLERDADDRRRRSVRRGGVGRRRWPMARPMCFSPSAATAVAPSATPVRVNDVARRRAVERRTAAARGA